MVLIFAVNINIDVNVNINININIIFLHLCPLNFVGCEGRGKSILSWIPSRIGLERKEGADQQDAKITILLPGVMTPVKKIQAATEKIARRAGKNVAGTHLQYSVQEGSRPPSSMYTC